MAGAVWDVKVFAADTAGDEPASKFSVTAAPGLSSDWTATGEVGCK
jgi:hypothetical protein